MQPIFNENQMKQVLEGLLFASHEPLSINRIREILESIQPTSLKDIRTLLQILKIEYDVQQRAFKLDEIAQGFILRTREEYNRFIELLGKQPRPEKLSPAASEVLAIVAYRQPITKAQIEAIRGVDCSGVLSNLLERQLIHPTGKLEAPGRPTLYGITQTFLKYYGLKDLKELPTI